MTAIVLGLGLAAAGCRSPARELSAPSAAAVHERLELSFTLARLSAHPDEVVIRARFTAPSGRVVGVGGFADGERFVVRFAPAEEGRYRYAIDADQGDGPARVAEGAFRVAGTGSRRQVRVSPRDPHRLELDDGAPFHPLGENRINVYDPSWNYRRLGTADYVAYMAEHGMNALRVFIFSDCDSEEAPDRRQPGCLEPALGRFDPEVARGFDVLFEAAERHGVKVMLTAFAIGFSPDDDWKSWKDNPYSVERGGPARSHYEFFESPVARRHAARRLRYLADRWAYSPSLWAIDLLNEPEWDGAIPEVSWIPWAEEMSARWRGLDPYGHLVTAGPVGLHWNVEGDERPWFASARNDIVQWHLYGEEVYEVHALAAELTRKTRETWPYEKPVLVGEFAYGGEPKPLYDHTHVGLWAATFSGAGVLAHSAPPFNIDSDELMTPERARHFLVLSRFLERLRERPLTPTPEGAAAEGMQAWAMGDGEFRAVWLLGPERGYGEPVRGATLEVRGLASGEYRVRFFDDVTGGELGAAGGRIEGGILTVPVPDFVRHLAAVVERR